MQRVLALCAVGGRVGTDCRRPGTCECLRACEAAHLLTGLVSYCFNVSQPGSWGELLSAPTVVYEWARPLPLVAVNVEEVNWRAPGPYVPAPHEVVLRTDACGHGYTRQSTGQCMCFQGYTGEACEHEALVPDCLGPCSECPPSGNCLKRPEARATRRPKVFVYDLPPGFNSWRERSPRGSHRDLAYMLWNQLGSSEYITTVPEEADLFFLPVTPFAYHEMTHGLILLALRYVSEAHPWFNASGGANHFIACPWDYGCTWIAGYPGLERVRMLTHWGLTVRDERYSMSCTTCAPPYVPGKDVVVPDLLELDLKAAPPSNLERTTLLFFAGTATSELRKTIFAQPWRNASGVRIGRYYNMAEEMDSARYCLVLPGSGYTTRGTLAIIRGCIPVIVSDHVVQPFEEVLPYRDFSLRVPEADVAHLLERIGEVTPARELAMRERLAEVAPQLRWDRDALDTLMGVLAREEP